VGTGIEIPSPRQPWTLPWVWDPHGDRDPHGYGYVVGLGIEIPSPRQPWTLPWVWGSPWVWVCGGYGEGNSVPTAALDSAVGMGIAMGIGIPMGMGREIPSPRQL